MLPADSASCKQRDYNKPSVSSVGTDMGIKIALLQTLAAVVAKGRNSGARSETENAKLWKFVLALFCLDDVNSEDQ